MSSVASSPFSSVAYQNLQRDFDTLQKLEKGHDDKLGVEKGRLVMSRGGFLQAPSRTFKNLSVGGYNREAVTDYLENLAQRTTAFIQDFKSRPDSSTYGSEYSRFVDTLDDVASAISGMEFHYRNNRASPAGKDNTAKRLSAVYDVFSKYHKIGVEDLENKKWTFAVPQTKPALDLTSPIVIRRVTKMKPSDYTPEELLQLAQAAKAQRVPVWKKVGMWASYIFSTMLAVVPIGLAMNLKWILWNPVELALKGRITTQNPMNWWINSWSTSLVKIHDNSEAAIGWYAYLLLQAPQLTDKHVEAFCQLAPHVKELDTIGRPNKVSKKQLMQMIEAVGRGSRCSKINISEKAKCEDKEIRGLLEKYGFQQDKKLEWKFTR